ncbi:MAG: hypothetical protein AAB589_03025 [Patescibacteria group bacterium]
MDWSNVIKVFRKALLAGYASQESGGSNRMVINELPGSKITKYEDKELGLVVVDHWYTTSHSDFSFGTATVSDEKGVIWMLQYRGWYTQPAIPFLKEALAHCDGVSRFSGRGPIYFTKGKLQYFNLITFDDGDRQFSGREEVRSEGHSWGWHEYNAMRTSA